VTRLLNSQREEQAFIDSFLGEQKFGNCLLVKDTVSKGVFLLVHKHPGLVLGRLTSC
jgi:hypothetical protein